MICHFCSRYRIYSDRKPSFSIKKRVPQRFTAFDDNKPILPQIKKKDRLLSYPFDSIKPFINMLREAADDKKCGVYKNDIVSCGKAQ